MPGDTIEDNRSTHATAEDESAVDSLLDSVLSEGSSEEATPGTPSDIVQKPEPKAAPKPPEAKPATKADEKAPGKAGEPETTPEPVKPAAEPGKPAEVKAEPEVKKPAPEVKDPELDAIQQPQMLSPKNKKGWEDLRGLAQTRKVELDELKPKYEQLSTQVQELTQKLQGKELPDDVKAEVEKLREENGRYKALYTNERDPAFVEKYDKALEKNVDGLYSILKNNGATDEDVEKIKKAGGILSMSNKWWNEKVFPHVKPATQGEILQMLAKDEQLKRERQETLDAVPENWKKFEEEQKERGMKAYEADQKVMGEHVTALTKDIPWAKLQEVPATATPEQKAQIEKANTFYKESEARFQSALYPADPRTRVETALAACLAFKYADELEVKDAHISKVEAENARLNEELGKIKTAGITSSAVQAPLAKSKAKSELGTLLDMKSEDAIEAQLKEMGI
jgi:hypothetical protein